MRQHMVIDILIILIGVGLIVLSVVGYFVSQLSPASKDWKDIIPILLCFVSGLSLIGLAAFT